MLPRDIRIEGRNIDILPEWREKIETELAHLQKHSSEPLLHARAELIGTGHHRHGAFELHLVVAVTGRTITVSRQGEYVLPLIVEAFQTLERRLREHFRQKHRQVKIHEEHIRRGRIARLLPEENFGFIAAPDGGEVYFHAHALPEGVFEKLSEGQAVEFGQEEGDKGPQAAWVRLVSD